MEKKWITKLLSCFLVLAMALTTVFTMPTMNAEAAAKKAAMSKTSVTLIVDKTCTLSVNNAKGKATWSTSDKKIAAVSKTGDRSAKITAKKTGTATITAKIGSKKYTCKVKVENPKLSATSKTLNTKDAKTATIQLNSTSQGGSVKWSTSDSKIVSIKASKNKVTMTAKKAGSATVSATVGGKKFSCKVTVEKSHNYKKGKTVAATCSKKGYTEYKCACGKSYKKEIKATGKHDYSVKKDSVAATCTEDGYTIYKCKTCDKTTKKTIKATGHNWGEWYQVGNCTTGTTEQRDCQNPGCSYSEERERSAREHQFGEWYAEETLDNGKVMERRYCKVCGDSEEREFDESEHQFDEWTTTKEASCDEDGEAYRTCSDCGYVERKKIAALGHDYEGEYELVQAPTCTRPGEEAQRCQRCGKLYEGGGSNDHYHVLAPTGHDYGEWKVTTKATATKGGVETRTCKTCGAAETRKTDPSEHDFSAWNESKAPTCTEPGQEKRTCKDCGKVETREVAAAGHDYGEETIKEATCTEDGLVRYTCRKCGAVEEKVTEATGHDMSDWSVEKEATCTEAGIEKRFCWNFGCDYEETREIPATGEHIWGDWETVSEPTDTEPGKQVRTCSSCGLQEEREIHF